jgi:hypothetical protein
MRRSLQQGLHLRRRKRHGGKDKITMWAILRGKLAHFYLDA